MANKRIFYPCQSVAFSECGANSFTASHGVQSLGMSTRFNLEQVFELSQLAIYQNIENIPDVEITLEKVLDGYPLLYHQATKTAGSATLVGRSNVKCTVGLCIYSDMQDSASGTPINQCVASGMYVSSLGYNIGVQGNATEQITLVGQNKVWGAGQSLFTPTTFNNTDTPAAAEGVNRRQHLRFGSNASLLPQDIPNITSSGTNELTAGDFGAHLQSVRVSTNLGRDQLFELGRKGPFHRYVSFPVEVRCDIEILDISGDNCNAFEESDNVVDRRIKFMMQEGTILDLGTKNKLSSVNYGGANAGQNGGNATTTFSYVNQNDLAVYHPQDPTDAIDLESESSQSASSNSSSSSS